MFLRNYYNAVAGALTCETAYSQTQPVEYNRPVMLRMTDGRWRSYAYGLADSMQVAYPLLWFAHLSATTGTPQGANFQILVYNTQQAEVGFDDYTMSGTQIGLTLTSGQGSVKSLGYDDETHSFTYTRSLVLTNATGSNQTFNSIGLVGYSYNSNGGSSYNGQYLFYKDIFEPITLEQGESIVLDINGTTPLMHYEPYPTA